MVYARDIGDRTITFRVSGKLWNRSLVMMDVETESLWSHILGEAMEGELKGTVLEVIPGSMMTWTAWRRAYPNTTAIDLSRTRESYTAEFYEDLDRFVLGWQVSGSAYACSFEVLREHPVLNLSLHERPLLVTYDPNGTGAHLFSRRLDDGVLVFDSDEDGTMHDRGTGSTWDRQTGRCVSGPLKGRALTFEISIMSFARAWETFHPSSRSITAQDAVQ